MIMLRWLKRCGDEILGMLDDRRDDLLCKGHTDKHR